MGEANQRGDFEERREEALYRDAEVVIFLRREEGSLAIGTLPQTEDQDGPAMIFARFINANFPELVKMAIAAHQQSRTTIPAVESPQPPQRPSIITEATPRIVGADGPATAAVQLVGPDGSILQ